MIIGLGSASLHDENQKPYSEYFIPSMENSINNVSLILSDGKEFVINNTQPEY
jgi:hypothetical protein